ncbi:cadherin-related family member 2-like [Cheilinus undulatus]|uniref:cadherin-related family member 2-like n=1 Tax=Cheilinus undulatus TaxID=241271 RepID=UPI001BD548EE|nr:cadherin-related family member 2-like [Cheilinus undulatus]
MEGFSRSLLLCLLLCLINTAYANTTPSIDVTTYTICVDIPPGERAFTIAASDLENDPLTFTITGINAEYFTVEENTGVVRVRRPLDRQATTMDLVAVVSDGTTSDSADLLIILMPTNSYIPQFEEASYDYNCPENTTVGSSLFTVRATDEDTGVAGTIKYSIDEVVPSSGSGLFTIDASSGEVRLAGGLNFTHLDTFYRLKINATDGGGKCHFTETTYFSSVAVANITVKDVPDLDPVFTGDLPYIRSVNEHSQVDVPLFQVTARDPDTGINAEINFSIEDSTIDGLFKISSAGMISVLSDIDREDLVTDTVNLTVKATESRLNIDGVFASTTTSVVINIIDINDNNPKFPEPSYTFHVSENSPIGTVVAQITATDADEPDTENSQIKYRIETSRYSDLFTIDPDTGVLTNSGELDYEALDGSIELNVTATDKGVPPLSATVPVIININEVNEVHLEFSSPVEEVKEELDDIIRVLRAATNATIEIVSIIPATSTTGAIIIARFVYSDGTTLTADDKEEMISDPEYSSELEDLGLIDIRDGSSEPPDKTVEIVLGVLGGLISLVAVVICFM